MENSFCITVIHRLCEMMYFYIVDYGNAQANNITWHKKTIHMIYLQSDIIYFYLCYFHQIMLTTMMYAVNTL